MERRKRRSLKCQVKPFLNDNEYKKFSLALRTFCKTKDVEKLGIELQAMDCNPAETIEIVRLTRQFLPANGKTEFMEIIHNLEIRNQRENCAPNHQNINHSSSKLEGNVDLNSRTKNIKRLITMDRSSLQIDFGFRIKGDLFTKQEIIVGKVDKESIAEVNGLQEGIRIIAINGAQCKRARKADVIQLVKNSLNLRLDVIVLDRGVEHVEETTATMKHITVCSNESGWLGLSIRGGKDYGCAIYVTSVDSGSPAERAGLQVGDVLREVNGVKLHGKTHIQTVEQIVTTCPPITFLIQTNKDQGTAIQDSNNRHSQPRTPLRMLNNIHRPRARVIPERHTMDWTTNIANGIDSLFIQGSPPPPYSEELPEAHQVIQTERSPNEDGDLADPDHRHDHIYDAVENVCNYVETSANGVCNDGSDVSCELNGQLDQGLSNSACCEYGQYANYPSLTDHIYDNVEIARNGESSVIHNQGRGSCSTVDLCYNDHIYDEVYGADETESTESCDMSNVNHDHYENDNRDDNGNNSDIGNHGDNGNYGNYCNHGNNSDNGNNSNNDNNGDHSEDGNSSSNSNHGNSTSKKTSLLTDICNFKNSTLRKAHCTSNEATSENATRKQDCENLLGIINSAIVNRARAFESSLVSWDNSWDSEWDL